ncbi:hypothetical protein ABEB36_010717 [Hypothenemus hampei]|uniref:Uncharacterized protein n=1 Tax=Hypothenemus hampei TaxID=57062 RepID=A0ABD1ECX3_HYPHA
MDPYSSDVSSKSLYSEKSKQLLNEALQHCKKLLVQENLITNNLPSSISAEAELVGSAIFYCIVEILSEKEFVEDDELICNEEEEENNLFQQVSDSDSDDDAPIDHKRIRVTEQISLETKIKVVRLARQNPKWSLKTLQVKGSRKLKSKDDIRRWECDIVKGGTIFDKYATIDSRTYDRFVESREQYFCRKIAI